MPEALAAINKNVAEARSPLRKRVAARADGGGSAGERCVAATSGASPFATAWT